MNLTIERNKWARGGMNGQSALLNNRGNMCCLGFYCAALGFSLTEIDDLGMPAELANNHESSKGFEWLVGRGNNDSYRDSEIGENLAHINDRSSLTESEREATIIELFKDNYVKVTFV